MDLLTEEDLKHADRTGKFLEKISGLASSPELVEGTTEPSQQF